jgi:hypothetical protein
VYHQREPPNVTGDVWPFVFNQATHRGSEQFELSATEVMFQSEDGRRWLQATPALVKRLEMRVEFPMQALQGACWIGIPFIWFHEQFLLPVLCPWVSKYGSRH